MCRTRAGHAGKIEQELFSASDLEIESSHVGGVALRWERLEAKACTFTDCFLVPRKVRFTTTILISLQAFFYQ